MSKRITQLDRDIAERLRTLRGARKMTQTTVAGFLGIQYQSYQKMEGGKTSFRAESLHRLSQLFVVPVSYFYNEDAYRNVASLTLRHGAALAHITAVMQGLNNEQARELVALASKLKQG